MYDPDVDHGAGSIAGAAGEAPRPGSPVEPARILFALRGSRRRALRAAVVTAVIGLIGSRLVPREYAASTILIVASGPSGEDAARHVKTVAETVKLPSVLEATRARMPRPASLEQLGRAVTVEITPDSNVLTIRATANAPPSAVDLADGVARSFIDFRIETERARLQRELTQLEDDVRKGQARAAEAHGAYDRFRAETGSVDPQAEAQAAILQAERIRAEAGASRATADAELARTQFLKDTVKREPSSSVIGQQEVNGAAVRLADVDAQLEADRARLSPDHPRIVALRSQAEALRVAGGTGGGIVTARTTGPNPNLLLLQQHLNGAESERTAAESRQAALGRIADELRLRAESRLELQGRASALLREIKDAEQHVSDLERNRLKAADEARSPVAGVVVTAPAQIPTRPVHATGRLVVALSPFVGPLLVFVATLARALRGLRLHTASEVAFWARAPVVASVAAERSRAVLELCNELGSRLLDASGTVLLTSLRIEDDDEACALADAINRLGRRMNAFPSPAEDLGSKAVWCSATDPEIRRKARQAARVLVVLRSGGVGAATVSAWRTRLGVDRDVAFAIFGLGLDAAAIKDRIGEWSGVDLAVEHSNTTPKESHA